MENDIRHDGIIESMAGGHIRVRIVQTSACTGCKIAGHCNASETKVKMIDVYDCQRDDLNVGDAVVVSTSVTAAGQSLMLGFGLPLVLLLVVLALMLALHFSEGVAALSALAALIPYYIIIWLCRHHIAKVVTFTIE